MPLSSGPSWKYFAATIRAQRLEMQALLRELEKRVDGIEQQLQKPGAT